MDNPYIRPRFITPDTAPKLHVPAASGSVAACSPGRESAPKRVCPGKGITLIPANKRHKPIEAGPDGDFINPGRRHLPDPETRTLC